MRTLTISYWWQLPMPFGRWLYDNPHTQYTLHIDIEKRRRRRCVYDWRGFKIHVYDWRCRLSHMQMTDSDFTLNDWRRRRRSLLQACILNKSQLSSLDFAINRYLWNCFRPITLKLYEHVMIISALNFAVFCLIKLERKTRDEISHVKRLFIACNRKVSTVNL